MTQQIVDSDARGGTRDVRRFRRSHNCLRRLAHDGGVRSGSDVLKALAVGADLVWIGRAVLWALRMEGQ